MDYEEHIERALAYIEANLKAELGLADLAKAAGYSKYHFLRVFKQLTRLAPADYIRKRRLSEIAREIDKSDRSVSDIAFDYGFNSKENFTRAFKAEHNVLPTEYKSAGNSLKLYDRLRLTPPEVEVTPEIIALEHFSLTVYKSDEDYTPNFWNKYNCGKWSQKLSGGKTVADYGVCRWNHQTNRLDYYCGIRTDEADGDTSGTIRLDIPGGLYAFTSTPPTSHFDFVNTIHRTWSYILNIWMPQSGYRCAGDNPYQFETYVEASRRYSEDIYIPVEKK